MLLYWNELLTKSFETFKNTELFGDNVGPKQSKNDYLVFKKTKNIVSKNKLKSNFNIKIKKPVPYSSTTLKLYKNLPIINIKKFISEINFNYFINFNKKFNNFTKINIQSMVPKNFMLKNLYQNLINFNLKKPNIFKNISNFYKNIKSNHKPASVMTKTFKNFNELKILSLKVQEYKKLSVKTTLFKHSHFFNIFLKNKSLYNLPKPIFLNKIYLNILKFSHNFKELSTNMSAEIFKKVKLNLNIENNLNHIKFFKYPNNLPNKYIGNKLNAELIIKKSPYTSIKSMLKILNFKNESNKSINIYGYNFIKFKIKKLKFYNVHKTLDNLNLELFTSLKRENSHYNYEELDNTWNIKVNLIPQVNTQPLRLVKHMLTNEYLNKNSDLLKFNYFDNNNEMGAKVPDNNDEHWVMKQKRLKKIKDIEPSNNKDYEYVNFDVMRNIYKKQIINNLKLITDIEFLMNPYDLYKCVRNNRSRSENLPIHIYRRLLRTTTTLVLPAHVNITVVTNSYDVVHS